MQGRIGGTKLSIFTRFGARGNFAHFSVLMCIDSDYIIILTNANVSLFIFFYLNMSTNRSGTSTRGLPEYRVRLCRNPGTKFLSDNQYYIIKLYSIYDKH